MQIWQFVVGCIVLLIVALLFVVLIAVLSWMAIEITALLKVIQRIGDTAPDFVTSVKGLAEASTEIKLSNKAVEGHIKLGEKIMLEYVKLRLVIDRFSRLVMQPQLEKENEKYGYAIPTDEDAGKQALVNEFVAGGYSKEEAETMADTAMASVGI